MAAPADYSIDPSTNPASWPTPHQTVEQANISKFNVDFINTNTIGDSDFHNLRIGAEGHVHHVFTQVTKHLARGIYHSISLNATEHSCVVVYINKKEEK
ncbi:hypothetical protein CPAR01_04154 [Colletotrichum paranaense]|uniref:Uncharacterized protein n=1 Tax=Colletotrichum paranaense TaxID=1914294 RepID=A0ABQ9SVH9_9PEZI|nr:uncharacterized protein CPAR01_04154 [Colletotrichum paranaense]KAK1543521.1 hypothetical protein CPAR01_04154 [Colletotrichum paranaense]